MVAYWMWWIAAAALVAVELLVGTFYLLVVGLAVACGGIAAWLGAPAPLQWLIAGVLGVVGTMALRRWKRRLMAGHDLGPRSNGTCVVSWKQLGRRTCGARYPAGRDDVHHRDTRFGTHTCGPPSGSIMTRYSWRSTR